VQQTKGIFWLSSYPKSGNTWFRIFLANLLHIPKEPIALNDVDCLINDRIVTDRTFMDKVCGFNTALFTDDELDALTPRFYEWIGKNEPLISYHKLHKAYTFVNNNEPIIPTEGCLGTIYFVRNPLDIAVSLANHFSFSIDEAIKILGNKTYALHHYPLRQTLLSWSLHVNSWVTASNINLLVLRYEDLHLAPQISFSKAAEFLQLTATSDKLNQAIQLSKFDKLQQDENTIGFMDKPPKLKNFFRKGIIGDWQNTLTDIQVRRIIQDHGDVMQTFGYLDNQYQPIVESEVLS
jgi:hypothetical protein